MIFKMEILMVLTDGEDPGQHVIRRRNRDLNQEIGAPDDRDGMDNLTISRCPHDLDTDNNASDFRLATATPGVGNECDEP